MKRTEMNQTILAQRHGSYSTVDEGFKNKLVLERTGTEAAQKVS
jgi:hypothetical protein